MIIEKTEFRPAGPDDRLAIRALHRRAFGRDDEAGLVDALAEEPCEIVSMVAGLDGMIVGHVLMTEISGPERGLALEPLAVDPDWRDFQIGTELTRRAIAAARDEGWRCIFVRADAVYYARFGFKSRTADGLSCAYQGPQFMALELEEGALAGYRGPVDYPAAFATV